MDTGPPQDPPPPPDRDPRSPDDRWPDPPADDGGSAPPTAYGDPDYDYDEPERDGPSWERRDEIGWVSAALATVKEVLFQPVETFARARRTGGISSPLLYALIMGTIFGLIGGYIELGLQTAGLDMPTLVLRAVGFDPSALQGGIAGEADPLSQFASGVGRAIALPFIVPLFALIAPFIGAAVYHVCLLILGGARRDFETTYRVVAYALGSLAPLVLIPFCGRLVSGIWGLVLYIIGLSQMHETDTWRALIAVLLPLLLFCCCCLVVLVMFFGAAAQIVGAP